MPHSGGDTQMMRIGSFALLLIVSIIVMYIGFYGVWGAEKGIGWVGVFLIAVAFGLIPYWFKSDKQDVY